MSRKNRIYNSLVENLHPTHLEVKDFSHEHSAGADAESHFTVIIASESFEGKRLVMRHRLVYSALSAEMNSGLHALQIHAYTESELEIADITPPPKCRGGE